jgi:hypothetical protein
MLFLREACWRKASWVLTMHSVTGTWPTLPTMRSEPFFSVLTMLTVLMVRLSKR